MKEFNFFKNNKLNKIASDSYKEKVFRVCECGSRDFEKISHAGINGNGTFIKRCLSCKKEENINWEIERWYENDYKVFKEAEKQFKIKEIIKLMNKE
jgi:hypothetical protein